MALFSDVCTALVTPYNEKGPDFDSLGRIIDNQIKGGVSALLVFGAAGERQLLTAAERRAVVKFAADEVRGRVPVICGCGGEELDDALQECKTAEKLGVDALLVGAPRFLAPSQEGAATFFKHIADNASAPVIIRSGRGFCLDSPTVRRLCVNRRIVAVLDCAGDIGRTNGVLPVLDETFSLYCGIETLALPMLSIGARGVMSVAANAFLPLLRGLCAERTVRLHSAVCAAAELVFCEVCPVAIKYIMAKLGQIGDYYLRQPLPVLSDEKRRLIDGGLELLKAYL